MSKRDARREHASAAGRQQLDQDQARSSWWKRRSNLLLGAGLIAATLLTYQPAWTGKPLLDDSDRFIRTPELRSMNGLAILWFQPRTTRQYHPIVDTAYWIEDRLWGENVIGYHIVTLLLHATSALLVVAILRKLGVPGGWFAAAIFALHPVETESVAWMVELKNTLSGVLFFAAVLLYLRFDEDRRWQPYLAVLICFTLGILAKAIVATFPAVILILIWWRRDKIGWRRDVVPLLPFVGLGIAAGLLSAWMERAFSGAEGEEFAFPPIDRLLIAGRAFWFYVGKVFWPTDLVMIYPRWKIDSTDPWQYLFPLAAAGVFVFAWLRRHQWRWLWAALLFFVVTIGPLLGFFNVSFFRFSFVADHFQYIPSLGIIVPVAAGASAVMNSFATPALARTAALASLALLAGLSWKQTHMYQDNEVCYRTILSKNPNSWNGHYQVGAELLKRGQIDGATTEFQTVLALEPANPLAEKRARIGLGSILVMKRDFDGAIDQFETALRFDPKDAPAHNGIASAYHRTGRLAEAIAEYERTLQLRPNSPVILSNLAWMLATCSDGSLRNGDRAVALASRANEISRGGDAKVLRSLAAAYAEVGDFSDASRAALRALQLSIQDGETPFRTALRHELALFDAGIPYHESAN